MTQRLRFPARAGGWLVLVKQARFLLLLFFSLSFCGLSQVYAQGKTVTGTITDVNGIGLPSATVTEKGTSNATTTDVDGKFSIRVNGASSILVISSVGMQTQEVTVGNQSSISLSMTTDVSNLEDVVVVGYGTQKKVTVTGAVAQVKGADLEKSPTVNLSNSLVGRLPGITAINSSGEPGYDGSAIRIRGTNSFGNTNALIVIDGVPDRSGGLDRLNPADIESVSILKDASAAIYGSRAANGVILITTKRGKSGKPQLSYDFNQGWAQPTRIPKVMDAVQYGIVRNELQVYDRLNDDPSQWAAAIQALNNSGEYTRTDNGVVISSPAGFSPADMAKYADGSDPWGHPNTDWFGAVLKKWSPQQRHNVQINGGTENVHYLASLGYQNQDGYYVNSATGYKQYDMRLNLDAKVNEYVNVSIGVLGREEFRFFPTEGAGAIFRMLMRGKPNETAIWPNGLPGRDIENGQQPVVITTNKTGYDKDKRDYVQTNGKLEIKIPWVDGLKLTGVAALDKFYRNRKRWATPWYLYSWDGVSYEPDGVTPSLTKELRSTFTDPRLNQYNETSLNTTLSGLLNYDKSFGDHQLNFLAGVQRETLNFQGFDAFRRYFISTAVDQLFAGGSASQNINGGEYNRARLSYFGRVGYNFQEKYIAEFIWRYDGSYLFPQSGRFGFFPGIMAGWRISEENFFKNTLPFIDNLKLRGSWGQMGAEPYRSDGSLFEYQFLSTYAFSTYVIDQTLVRGLSEARLANPDFTWEVQNSLNLGIDGAVLRNRLSFEFDYFMNKRNNILLPPTGAIPASTGITNPPPVNYGRLDNKGFEFKVDYTDRAGDVVYAIGVNGGYAKNKIVQWTEAPGIPEWQKATGGVFGAGGPAFLVYEYDGVFSTQKEIDDNTIDYSGIGAAILRPGDMKLKDINGDGKITGDDQVRQDKTRDPRFTYGINGRVGWKNFDMTFLFQGATGGLLYIQTESGDIGNYLEYAFDHRWTVDNQSKVDPRIASRNNTFYTGGGAANNSYWLRSSNYLRLKNFEIGYNVPASVLSSAKISNIRLYVSGLNLVTWDKMKIWDPEATSGSGQYYPQSRIVNLGASVTF